MKINEIPRAVITAVVLLLFGYAYAQNPSDEMMKGALIAAFSLAVSYWLGSSKGSSDKAEQIERQDQSAQVERRFKETQNVVVVNQPDDPVPTRSEDD